MDENLLEFIYDANQSITIKEAGKALLSLSIFNDTLFLEKVNVMDYSLLVGIDVENQELVVGIIGLSLWSSRQSSCVFPFCVFMGV